jgi:UDP-N-acetylglucosamine 4,6-dehydratase/5-epimerase
LAIFWQKPQKNNALNIIMDLNNKSILITGGTGSFGKAFVQSLLQRFPAVKRIIVFSRDEQKQFDMMNELPPAKYPCMQYYLGDVRDRNRLIEVSKGVDILIHSAAMKHVPASEMNPMECVKTNILGSQNVIDAALANNVKVVVALSTDKAASPANFYGATKFCLEKLFTFAECQKAGADTRFSVVRYANVFGSKGSVVPLFHKLKGQGFLPITHAGMTRFSITMQNALDLVYYAIDNGWGGEIILPISSSYKVVDVATAIAPELPQKTVGIRPGEKLHETMYTEMDSYNTVKRDDYFIICPGNGMGLWAASEYAAKTGAAMVPENRAYASDTNDQWLGIEDLRKLYAGFEATRQ